MLQVQCIAMAFWTSEVTDAIHISNTAMRQYWDKCNFQISKIVDLVRGELSLQNRITLGMSPLQFFLFNPYFGLHVAFVLFAISEKEKRRFREVKYVQIIWHGIVLLSIFLAIVQHICLNMMIPLFCCDISLVNFSKKRTINGNGQNSGPISNPLTNTYTLHKVIQCFLSLSY